MIQIKKEEDIWSTYHILVLRKMGWWIIPVKSLCLAAIFSIPISANIYNSKGSEMKWKFFSISLIQIMP